MWVWALWKQAVGCICPAGMNLSTFAPLAAWPWASVCSTLAGNSFDLAAMAEQSNPSAAFLLFLPSLCVCHVSCCSLTTSESFPYQKSASHAESWPRADASLLKSWCNSGVRNWGESNQNHILTFSEQERNEKQKIQGYGYITDFQPDFLIGQSHEKFLLPNAVCSSALSALVMSNTILKLCTSKILFSCHWHRLAQEENKARWTNKLPSWNHC